MSFYKVLPLLGAFLMLHTACQDDSGAQSFDTAQLLGRWEISKAYRNGKLTETLTDTFYEFDDIGNMKTNLNPAAIDETYPYEFDGIKINQKGGVKTVYTVEDLTDSTLTMSMTISNFPFRLKLFKVIEQDTSATQESILQ